MSTLYLEGSLVEALVDLAHAEGLLKIGAPEGEQESVLHYIKQASCYRARVLEALLLYDKLVFCDQIGIHAERQLLDMGIEPFPLPHLNCEESESWAIGPDERKAIVAASIPLIGPYLERSFGYRAEHLPLLLDLLHDPSLRYRIFSYLGTPMYDFLVKLKIVVAPEVASLFEVIVRAHLRAACIDSTKLSDEPQQTHSWGQGPAAKGRAAHYTYALMLGEIPFLPAPRTMGEALELRQDRRVQDFRSVLWRWTQALRTEGAQAESRLRVELGAAAKSLARLPRLRSISRFVTYLSLPLCFVQLLGLPFAVVGAGAQVATDLIEYRHRWLMIRT